MTTGTTESPQPPKDESTPDTAPTDDRADAAAAPSGDEPQVDTDTATAPPADEPPPSADAATAPPADEPPPSADEAAAPPADEPPPSTDAAAAPPADEPQLSAAEREYREALKTARQLGLDEKRAPAADADREEATRLAARLGLDQPTAKAEEVLPVLEEPAEAEPEEEVDEGDELIGPPPTDARSWYVLNTYSGHEHRVQENLERRVASMDVTDRIFRVVVPTEEELEIRGGQRRQVQRRLLPGYVLVEMILDNDTWYVVRNTPGVTGFVGTDEPKPLPREEVKTILRQMRVAVPRVRVGFEIGDTVRVVEGPFLDFMALVDQINLEKGKVRALITMFGREIPVELDFIQVEKA